MNPFLTVYGPRPERWWAVCNLCGKTSSARFASEAEVAEWEHDCHTETDESGTVTLTIKVSVDEPPKITWDGTLTSERLSEAERALSDMDMWQRLPVLHRKYPHWKEAVADQWTARRRQMTERAVAEMEHAVSHPFVCPGCTQRCMSVGGLKNHMRCCWKVDPHKFRRGEYDNAMVPGGAA